MVGPRDTRIEDERMPRRFIRRHIRGMRIGNQRKTASDRNESGGEP